MRILYRPTNWLIGFLAFFLTTHNVVAQPIGWTYNPSMYEMNMEIVAEVNFDNTIVTTGWLGAFAGSECRGYIAASSFLPENYYIFTLLIASNSASESISFRFSPDGNTIYDIVEGITFSNNDIQGNARNPITLNVIIPNRAPVITSNPITSAISETQYSYTITAEDQDNDVLSFSAPTLPDWLTFNPSSHILSGTPDNSEVGTHPVILRVSDGEVYTDQSFAISVTGINHPPEFTSSPITTIFEDSYYEYTVSAIDDDGDVLAFSAILLPDWLSFNPVTQELEGTPGNDDVGANQITLRVADNDTHVDQSFTIVVENVNDPPTINSSPVSSAIEDVLYTYTVTAVDIDGDDLSYTAPTMPDWLLFDATSHVLFGTPENIDVGDHSVTLRVSDGVDSDEQTFTIEVTNTNDAPSITSTPVTSATEESAYSYTITAEDIDGDVLAFSAILLPDWLSFNPATQELAGTPGNDDVGANQITLRVADNDIHVDQSFTIAVENVNDPPTINSSPVTSAIEDVLYSYTVTAVDIDGDDLSYTAPTMPDWLLFDATSHVLSGTPENIDVGDHSVTLRVSDGEFTDEQTFIIEVTNTNDAPHYTSTPITGALENMLYTYTVSAADDDGDVITFSAPLLPGWLDFNPDTRVLSGTPDSGDAGTHEVTISVTDGILSANQSFTITVDNENYPPHFTSTPTTGARWGIEYSYIALATDEDGDGLSYAAPVLPSWLNFNPVTRFLFGTPQESDVGTSEVTLRVSDGMEFEDQRFVISVVTDYAPEFISTPITEVDEDQIYNYLVNVEDEENDPITISFNPLPDWLAYDSNTGQLSGIPENDDVGDHGISITASDGIRSTNQAFIITVQNTNDAPVFTSNPVTGVDEDATYQYTVVANDVDGDQLTYAALTLPDWLSFNSTSHLLSGTPENDNVGTHDVTIEVSDDIVSVFQSFDIQVNNTNDSPTFTSTPITEATEDLEYLYTALAMDEDGDALTFTATVLPVWLSFDSSTGILSGIPENDDVGIHSARLRVSDGTDWIEQEFNIEVENVNDAPIFNSNPLLSVMEDSQYQYAVSVMDPEGDPATVTAELIPNWLSFNGATLQLVGTPHNEDVGNHTVTLRASDGSAYSEQEFTITVTNTNDPPVITSTPPTAALVDQLYTYTINATDIDNDILEYTAPHLPDWLNFDGELRTLSGTPQNSDQGQHPVTLRVTDGTEAINQSFIITVDDQNVPPSFTSTPLTSASEDALYQYTVSATDNDGDAIIYSAPSLPEWLMFDNNTLVLSGTPMENDAGNHDVTLRISDGIATVDQSFVITVTTVNDAPIFTSTPITEVTEDLLYTYSLTAEDEEGDEISYSAIILPSWLEFNPTSKIIAGTPENEDVGDHDVTLQASDGNASTDQEFVISVINVNDPPIFTSDPITSAKEGVFYEYHVVVEDIDGDDMTFSTPKLPDWLSFSESSSTLSGTPDSTDVGTDTITIEAYDGMVTVIQSFEISIIEDTGVGIDDPLTNIEMLVYPNPSHGRFIVEISNGFESNANLEIIDATGKLVIQREIPSVIPFKHKMELNQPPGIYYLRVIHQKNSQVLKIIIY